jgi:hypothetical protein
MSTELSERRWGTAEARWNRVLSLIDASGDCWEWTGYRDVHGYGGVHAEGKQWKAHGYLYTKLVGPVPVGLELDHLCRNKACVNPDHLEAVQHRVNSLRGRGAAAVNAARVTCPRGHRIEGVRGTGQRYCLTCNRIRARGRAE